VQQNYWCIDGYPVLQNCASGLAWHQDGQRCDWPTTDSCPTSTTTTTTLEPAATTTTTAAPTTTGVAKKIFEVDWIFLFGFAVFRVFAPCNSHRVLPDWNVLERRFEILWLAGQCEHLPLKSVNRCIVEFEWIMSKSIWSIPSLGIQNCYFHRVIT